MDKEIIIDGVDVSECYFLNKGITRLLCTCPSEIDEECKYNPNCYFKQLKLKEQECEELKAQLNDMACMDDDNVLCYPRQELKKECDRYRKALEEIGKIVKINCEEICGRKFEDCNDFLCSSKNILDIINKAKENN